jgi:hypothetical protein
MALMVRYDTRIRLFASYECKIDIGYEEATLTGGQFFHGGVSISPGVGCGPGSYIDIIPEDWRLLSSGKKRLVFDHTCGIIPLCPGPNTPPPHVPEPAHPPPNPSPVPSPPPFPPGQILPPFPPRNASPPSPSPSPGELPPTVELGSTSAALLVLGMAGLCSFACLQLFLMFWFRKSATAARAKNTAVPVAKISVDDGSTSIVTGVAVRRPVFGNAGKYGEERQTLLSDARC